MSLPTANQTIVGTCSICGGPACVPTAYHSIVPPVPKCADCGAMAKRNYGAVIPMEVVSSVKTWPSSITVEGSKRTYSGLSYDSALSAEVLHGEWAINEQQPGNS